MTEDGGQRTDDGGQRTEFGSGKSDPSSSLKGETMPRLKMRKLENGKAHGVEIDDRLQKTEFGSEKSEFGSGKVGYGTHISQSAARNT